MPGDMGIAIELLFISINYRLGLDFQFPKLAKKTAQEVGRVLAGLAEITEDKKKSWLQSSNPHAALCGKLDLPKHHCQKFSIQDGAICIS